MRILAVIGTRPEAIKMLPLIIELKKHPSFDVFVCSTGQHTDMLNGVFEYFNIEPDYRFCAMRKEQSLSELTIRLLRYFDEILEDANPDTVLVITSDHETGGVKLPTGSESLTDLITVDGHTATPVGVFAVGKGTEYFKDKTVDNTDIAKFLIKSIKGE